MAHDNYLSLISLSLDGLLTKDEQFSLEMHLQSCSACMYAWEQMSLVDRMFAMPIEVAPPPDFKSRVMEQVSGYEQRRNLYPWMTLIMTTILLVAMMSIILPILFVTLGLYRMLFDIPVIGMLLTRLIEIHAQIMAFIGTVGVSASHWISFLTTDPMALAVIVTSLVMLSIWIGMHEAFKLQTTSEFSAQSA
ncbi:MAG: zf-HC2 domain-containing protein [Anaerolineae bacterium]|nr:zf-HC2 domain-containing protein [Anaerolineae bacterium]